MTPSGSLLANRTLASSRLNESRKPGRVKTASFAKGLCRMEVLRSEIVRAAGI
jgi:hypothetical protein